MHSFEIQLCCSNRDIQKTASLSYNRMFAWSVNRQTHVQMCESWHKKLNIVQISGLSTLSSVAVLVRNYGLSCIVESLSGSMIHIHVKPPKVSSKVIQLKLATELISHALEVSYICYLLQSTHISCSWPHLKSFTQEMSVRSQGMESVNLYLSVVLSGHP